MHVYGIWLSLNFVKKVSQYPFPNSFHSVLFSNVNRLTVTGMYRVTCETYKTLIKITCLVTSLKKINLSLINILLIAFKRLIFISVFYYYIFIRL